MKLQLTINEHPLEGYIVLDPITNKEFDGDYVKAITSFEEGVITEIYAPQIVDYINWEQMGDMLKLIFTFLRKDCKLTIGGTEPYILTKKFINRQLDFEHYNEMLFRRKAKIKNLVPMIAMKSFMMNVGFSVEEVNISDTSCNYTIIGKRK